ncbi:MAG TPA: glycoside hydrolase family 15 protein [Verrucomicrobiae bacterium]|nr:glycoside hydrolase family 15 protein [Verrucomicrobiae bacterium]
MNYHPIENYGVIGDLTTTALVGMDGSIDFMCFPHFDSPTIFAALLDHKKGGRFQIFPITDEFKNRQRYFPDTNILLTRFLGESGIAEISDFMAMQHLGHSHNLVRRVKVVRGEIRFRMVFAPKFDYARTGHTVEKRNPNEIIFIPAEKHLCALRLRASVPVKIENGEATAEFKLGADKTAEFILEEADGKSPSASPDYVSEAFKETMNFWLGWVAKSKYQGRWREMVNRSALTLKLLTSRPHGSIVAAPTFGLPEKIGGALNWDYRCSWIRDASFTLYALMRLGYTGEAQAFMRWIEARCQNLKPGRPLQVMYRMDGERDITERTLKHFEGYRKSSPVRIGNAAYSQSQLDIYGELMDSILIYDKHGEPVSYDFWRNIVTLTEWVCQHWEKPDAGIWEERGRPKQFLYSKVMCWTAIDRALQLARRRSFPAPLVRWHRVRDKIYRDIYEKFWNPKLKSFVQYRGADTVDASALLMPVMKFISATDPRWKSTIQAIEEKLVEDSLVYRHNAKNATTHSRHGEQGTFSPCSFWYVECLSRAGDLKKARYIFEKTLGYANHLGLYAEELGPCGEHLGNFPLGLSHTGLINAAWNLDVRLSTKNNSSTSVDN